YFLFSLRQPQLQRALMPLGKMTKPEIREIAHSLGLKVADKIDSQEICFVPGNDYKSFLRSHVGEGEFHRGEIYDVDGHCLGEHGGIELFTIGQRKGLPGGSPRPRYVVDLDPATNRVIVGDADDLVTDEFEIDRVNWHPVAGADGSYARAVLSASPLAAGQRIEVAVGFAGPVVLSPESFRGRRIPCLYRKVMQLDSSTEPVLSEAEGLGMTALA